jgi:hypothetical protein
MASTSETGNAKNVANFKVLISFVTGFGAKYNPSKNALKLPQLLTLHTAAKGGIADVILKNTSYNNKVNERVIAFKDLKPLSTRLVNALESTEASSEKVADAKGFNKKLQGSRIKAVAQPTDPAEPAPKTISTSQQSYDLQIQHLEGLISVIESETSYEPNETELKVATLKEKLTTLTARNEAVADAYTIASNARISRDMALYGPEKGLFDTAAEIKKYVKSIDGSQSPQFIQIKGIEFSKKGK